MYHPTQSTNPSLTLKEKNENKRKKNFLGKGTITPASDEQWEPIGTNPKSMHDILRTDGHRSYVQTEQRTKCVTRLWWSHPNTISQIILQTPWVVLGRSGRLPSSPLENGIVGNFFGYRGADLLNDCFDYNAVYWTFKTKHPGLPDAKFHNKFVGMRKFMAFCYKHGVRKQTMCQPHGLLNLRTSSRVRRCYSFSVIWNCTSVSRNTRDAYTNAMAQQYQWPCPTYKMRWRKRCDWHKRSTGNHFGGLCSTNCVIKSVALSTVERNGSGMICLCKFITICV